MKAVVTYNPYRTGSEGSTVFVKRLYNSTKGAFLTTCENLTIPDHQYYDDGNWCLYFLEGWFTLVEGDEK